MGGCVMIKFNTIVLDNNGIIGTAIHIVAIFDEAPDSVTIIIENPSGIDKVDGEAMTAESGNGRVYSYVYQTTDTVSQDVGTYKAIISAVEDTYTIRDYHTFELIDVTD